MSATRGTQALSKARIDFTLHPYLYDPSAAKIGLAAALALGLDPALTLKTLMIEADGKAAFCVIPAEATLSMKKVAAAMGAKQAQMMPPEKAEKLSGYHVGGISPFGAKKSAPVFIEATPCQAQIIWINAGQRGLLLGISPKDALSFLGAKAADLSQ